MQVTIWKENMENIKNKLAILPEQACQNITTLITDKLALMGVDGILIGSFGEQVVFRIKTLYDLSSFMREVPYRLN